MKYFIQTPEPDDGSPDINMSPLIDMVFLLLIFFMVTSVFVQETGVTIDRPQATAPQALPNNSLLIALTQEGDIYYAGRTLTMDDVPHCLQEALQDQTVPVIILADRHAPAGDLIKLIDQCKLGGATQVSVAAKP